jgi:hypothetical protein
MWRCCGWKIDAYSVVAFKLSNGVPCMVWQGFFHPTLMTSLYYMYLILEELLLTGANGEG